jgi:hypothetical protein
MEQYFSENDSTVIVSFSHLGVTFNIVVSSSSDKEIKLTA